MTNILMVSPTPSHPSNAGNRTRIYSMVRLLKEQGCEIHFLFAGYETGDMNAMKEYWGNHFHYCELKSNIPNRNSFHIFFIIYMFCTKFFNLIKKQYYKIIYSYEQNKYNQLVDTYYNEHISLAVARLQNEYKFSHVIVEYVALSKVLKQFPANVLKIIDTHDIFSDRYKIYLTLKLQPQWWSFFKREESKGLNRSDVVIAIQDEEGEKLKEICSKRVLTFGHIINQENKSSTPFAKRLLFSASDNSINIEGINSFIDEVLPRVASVHPDLIMQIAGTINREKRLIRSHRNIKFIGEFDQISEPYSKSDIVINPIKKGTGLKIKTIEALAYSKPLVTFLSGLEGLSEYNKEMPFALLCKTSDEFADSLIELLDNEALRAEISKNALAYINSYNSHASAEFIKLFSK